MKDYDQENRKDRVYYSPPRESAKLVYDWIKTGTITLSQFRELVHLINHPGD